MQTESQGGFRNLHQSICLNSTTIKLATNGIIYQVINLHYFQVVLNKHSEEMESLFHLKQPLGWHHGHHLEDYKMEITVLNMLKYTDAKIHCVF